MLLSTRRFVSSSASGSAATRAIFCDGPILAAMQSQGIASANDSKAFVDQPLRSSAAAVLRSWHEGCGRAGAPPPSRASLAAFLAEHFDPAGSDLVNVRPADWHADASFLKRISNASVREFAKHVHGLWPALGRRTSSSVSAQPDRHTLTALPNAFIVPGGRFRESYYWDSLWIVRGLLISGMCETAEGMVRNLLHQVAVHGYVPNGNRIYYEGRSQPPVLSEMVRAVAAALNETRARAFTAAALPLLEVELEWWRRERSVEGLGLSFYSAATTVPRPESWREDAALCGAAAERGASNASIATLMRSVAAAAESGWDFSSRWLDAPAREPPHVPGSSVELLLRLNTSAVLAVDLNAILLRAELNVRRMHSELGNVSAASVYEAKAKTRWTAMESALWCDARGAWRDAGRVATTWQPLPPIASASDFLPLWAVREAGDAAIVGLNPSRASRAVETLAASPLRGRGGVGATVLRTGQQWDWPNGWAPLQLMLVEALREGDPRVLGSAAAPLGASIAQRWLASNIASFPRDATGMYEKFDVETVGQRGGGGEYAPQIGFGWTNGVALSLVGMARG